MIFSGTPIGEGDSADNGVCDSSTEGLETATLKKRQESSGKHLKLTYNIIYGLALIISIIIHGHYCIVVTFLPLYFPLFFSPLPNSFPLLSLPSVSYSLHVNRAKGSK